MASTERDVLSRINRMFRPVWREDGAHLYDDMDSQAAFGLPVIHVPFEAQRRSHWQDRGRILDYRAVVGSGRILDVGSGDGWPALMLAPMVDEVVAVDANGTLLAGASANGRRLGIDNVKFVKISSATRLPFGDASFRGATAGSSLEQTEDPIATLRELRRVLEPEARLRMYYEALEQYRGREHQAWLMGRADGSSFLYLSEYHVDEETARHIRLHLDLAPGDIRRLAGRGAGPLVFRDVVAAPFERLAPHVRDARGSRLRHPSGASWERMLLEAGFREVHATASGKEAAGRAFDEIQPDVRPRSMSGVDAILRPRVAAAVREPRPVATDPMITAIR